MDRVVFIKGLLNDNYIILLSGGLDSTACLLKYINKHKKDPILYYVDLENNIAKSWCEQYSIDCILKDLKREKLLKSSCFLHLITVKDLKIKQREFNKTSVLPVMTLVFLTNLIMHMYKYYNKETIITLGYTKGDDTSQIISHIKKLWCKLYALVYNKNIPKLKFPLLNHSKRKTLRFIKKMELKYNLDIVSKLWTCENPVRIINNGATGYKYCGNCGPCIKNQKLKIKNHKLLM